MNHRYKLRTFTLFLILSSFLLSQNKINDLESISDKPLNDIVLDIDNILERLEEVADNWKGQFAEPKVIDSQELEGDISTVKDSDYAEKVDTLVDKMEMNCYTWDSNFYNEIVKDWNYRFPKFSYIEYPEFKRGI